MESIDLSYIRSVADGDEDLVKQFIEIFISQVPEFTTDIVNARKTSDWRALAAAAHKAKSSIASMGLDELALNMKRLEMLCKSIYIDTTADNDTMCDSIKAQLQTMPDELKSWISLNKNLNAVDELINFYNLRVDFAISELKNVIDKS